MEMVAQLRESHVAAEAQNQAMDLTKVHYFTVLYLSPSLSFQVVLLVCDTVRH